jgi:hypothetical protein
MGSMLGHFAARLRSRSSMMRRNDCSIHYGIVAADRAFFLRGEAEAACCGEMPRDFMGGTARNGNGPGEVPGPAFTETSEGQRDARSSVR